MRVERALGKLQGRLAKRGIYLVIRALAAALTGQAVVAAPSGSRSPARPPQSPPQARHRLLGSPYEHIETAPRAYGAARGRRRRDCRDPGALEPKERGGDGRALKRGRGVPGAPGAGPGSRGRGGGPGTQLRDEEATVGILSGQVRDLEAKSDASRRPAVAHVPNRRALNLDAGTSLWNPSVLDQMPKMLKQNRPEYPPEMRNAGASGQVVVDFIVGTDGLVYNAFALSSSDQAFEDSAVNAVSQWTFSSGRRTARASTPYAGPDRVQDRRAAVPTSDTWF